MRKLKFEIIQGKKIIGYEEFSESFGGGSWFHVLYSEPEGERICHTGTYLGFLGLKRRQYLGLKDKNGKEIYEGDICKQNNLIDVIKWNNGSYWYNWLEGSQIENSSIEVIGNVYENPDLLQAKTADREG